MRRELYLKKILMEYFRKQQLEILKNVFQSVFSARSKSMSSPQILEDF